MAWTGDKFLATRLEFARGARLDPGRVEAAMWRTGIESETMLLEAALTLLAEPDDFGAWLVSQRGTLDSDFELAL